ncbi:EamA family transporter [Mycolicibacterium rufum]|uniref:EamA family transporter n=3 Tax=Mycolicibacterium rufum TaxID=318424 RepID=A0ABY3UJA8_9MYCO|nr:EamA family transporter [Mycolicibacterium rufum]KGI66387.1 membrane protein [Mycolicibacterium rufum]ULP37143.1 EamA family transporter [Mycolicibacterium rufum]
MGGGPARAGAVMAVSAMVSVQLGMAVAVNLIEDIGSDGTAWLRLAWAGLLLLVVVRPRPSSFTRKTFGMCVVLGVVSAAVSLFFMASLDRLPLGTATALEFLGPLAVAAAHGTGRARVLWPGLAAIGVVLLSQPFGGGVDLKGVLLALAAGAAWAVYILLTQNVGDQVAGVTGLAVSMPVAGVVATFTVSPAVFERMTLHVLLVGLGMAILLPVVPFVLELLALRRLTTAAFGTLMCLEPALAFVVGFTLLHQSLDGWAVAGIVVVVIAGVGAARSGGRQADMHIEVG